MADVISVYTATRAAPSGGFYGYVRDAMTHEILWRSALAVDAPTARERARIFITANAYRWSRVPTPDDAPPLFPGEPVDAGNVHRAQDAAPEPCELAMAADALRTRASALRANQAVGRHADDAAILDAVAVWLDRMSATR